MTLVTPLEMGELFDGHFCCYCYYWLSNVFCCAFLWNDAEVMRGVGPVLVKPKKTKIFISQYSYYSTS